MNRKGFICITAVIFVLAAYSCTLPEAIEVKAHPKMAVTVEKNISELFSDSMRGGFDPDDADMYDCTEAPGPQTFLLHIKKGDIDVTGTLSQLASIPDFNTDILAGLQLPELAIQSDATDPIDLAEMKNFLRGFDFGSVKGELVISGNTLAARDLVKLVEIDLKDPDGNSLFADNKITNVPDSNIPSETRYGLNNGADTTTLKKLPEEGKSFDLTGIFNSGNEMSFDYAIKVPGNAKKTSSMTGTFTNDTITMEILIWLPLEFKANPKPPEQYATLEIPDLFGEDTDIFGRKPGEESEITDMIHSAIFSMELNEAIFSGAKIDIGLPSGSTDLADKELKIVMTSDDMEYINRQPSFSPKIKILFKKDGTLSIPRKLEIIKVTLDAEITQRIDF